MTFLRHRQPVFLCENPWLKISRAGGIRTHDLLNPIQAFYQAELRPDEANTVAISGCEANVSVSANESSHQWRKYYEIEDAAARLIGMALRARW